MRGGTEPNTALAFPRPLQFCCFQQACKAQAENQEPEEGKEERWRQKRTRLGAQVRQVRPALGPQEWDGNCDSHLSAP